MAHRVTRVTRNLCAFWPVTCCMPGSSLTARGSARISISTLAGGRVWRRWRIKRVNAAAPWRSAHVAQHGMLSGGAMALRNDGSVAAGRQ